MRRRVVGGAVAILFGVLLVATRVAAEGTSVGVSTPPDPVPARAGEAASASIRVTNPTSRELPVEFSQSALELGDEGKVKALAGPDRIWASHVDLPQGTQKIPPDGYGEFNLSIHVPADTAPDIYLVGFAVTPKQQEPGTVEVVTRVVSYVVVDVAGTRDWKLSAALDFPAVVVAPRLAAPIRVRNVGRSSIRFWGEATTTSTPTGPSSRKRFEKLFLPAGRLRTLQLAASPRFGIGVVRVTARVSYPSGSDPATSRDVTVERAALVVSPLWLAGLALALVIVVAEVVRRRVKRVRAVRGAAQTTR